MKRSVNLIYGLLTALALSGLVYSNSLTNTEDFSQLADTSIHKTATLECKYAQCKATAKSTGKRCKHCVSNEGDEYCWQHKK